MRILTILASFAILAGGMPASAQQRIDPGATTAAAGGALGIGQNQFIQMAEQVMYDFVFSRTFERITEDGERPRIVVGTISNRTHNENIMAADMLQSMRQVLVGTQMARLFEQGTNDFDYIIASTLSSSQLATTSRSGPVETTYTFSIRVQSVEGEIISEHSVTQSFVS